MAIYTHITIGTNDLNKAKEFYDSVLGAIGYKHVFEIAGRMHGWGKDKPEFIVLTPSDGKAATAGNGFTASFLAPNRAAVDEFHKRGLALGGKDEGAPGPRNFAPNAYGAYLRDLDGNKFCAYSFTAE